MESKYQFLKNFDFYGEIFNIHVQGHKRYKTIFGSFISTLSLVAVCSLAIYFIYDFLMHSTYIVNFYRDQQVIPVNNLTNIPIFFTLADASANIIVDKGTYKFEVIFAETLKNQNGSSINKNIITPIPYKVCDKNDFSGYENLLNNFRPSNFFCLPRNINFTIYGKIWDIENGFSLLTINVLKCKNSTSSNDCLSDTKINTVLSNSRFMLNYISNSIDPNNYDSPNSQKVETGIYLISPLITKRYHVSLSQILYKTDYGLVFQNVKESNFYQYDDYKSEVDLGEILSILGNYYTAQISLRNHGQVSIYVRQYMKLQNLGGIVKFITFISKIIVYFFTKKFAITKVSNEIFKFYDDDFKENSKVNDPSRFVDSKLKIIRSNSSTSQVDKDRSKRKLNLTLSERLCCRCVLKKKKNLDVLIKWEEHIKKSISLDNITLQFHLIDIINKLLIESNQVPCFNYKKIPYDTLLLNSYLETNTFKIKEEMKVKRESEEVKRNNFFDIDN